MEEFGNAVKNLLKVIHKRLDTVALFNIVLLVLLFLFCIGDGIPGGISYILYTLGDIGGQLFLDKRVLRSDDSTPFSTYMFWLGLGLLVCIFIVFLNRKMKLWK